MTAGCTGGTSHVKPGVDAIVRYSSGLLAAIFAAYDIRFLIPVIPLVGLSDIPVAAFCATDPPAVPTYTAAEATALLNLDFGPDFDSGLSKTKDLILHAIWWDACECTSGTPIGFIPPTPPSGTPITLFPGDGSGGFGSAPCHDQNTGILAQNGSFQYASWLWRGTPSDLKWFRITIRQPTDAPANGVPIQWTVRQTGAFAIGLYDTRTLPLQFSQTVDIPVVAPAQEIRIDGTAGYNQTAWGNIEIQGFCGPYAAPPSTTPCCPPDSSTQSYLDNILQLVTLIQRQIVPFAHILGTAHSGLTGQGTISVSGLLGVKLDLTTIPASYGVQVGSPNYHFDLGWLSVLTPDGFIDERRVTAQLMSWLPRLMSDATVVGYSLSPGVVGTITEIVREP